MPKTPVEIVRLLRKCVAAGSYVDCADCPYYGKECDDLLTDAAAVIEALMGNVPVDILELIRCLRICRSDCTDCTDCGGKPCSYYAHLGNGARFSECRDMMDGDAADALAAVYNNKKGL